MKAMTAGLELLLVGLVSVAAGAVNALAGGGTLITFPMLMAVGVPAVAANVTSTVALSPGYLGGVLGQWKDLRDQKRRLWLLLPAGIIGGILGGILLLRTGERSFRALVPFLILLASGLLAIQDWMRARIQRRPETATTASRNWMALPVGLAAVYGGYFGAGLSVIVLAMLALLLDDSLTRLNALKQAVALSANVAAALFFAFSGQVVWTAALIMAAGALIGGVLGGRLAGKIQPALLRWTVVAIGILVAILYLMDGSRLKA